MALPVDWPHGLGAHDFSAEHYVGSWSLRNACVTFASDGTGPHALSRAGTAAVVHGFSEYRFGFVRLLSVRAATVLEEQTILRRCERRRHGLALPFLANNLYHALYHAVPAAEAEAGEAGAEAAAGEEATTLVPLIPPNFGLGRHLREGTTPLRPRAWHGWELSVRALTRKSAADIGADLERLLLRSGSCGSCVCFDRLRGNTHAFSPSAADASPRLRAFRRTVLANLIPVPGVAASTQRGGAVLLVWRRDATSRVLTNGDEVWRALRPLGGTRRVVLEAMPLSQQLRAVAAARGLVATHGQALALVPFLGAALPQPSDKQSDGGDGGGGVGGGARLGVIEILPSTRDLATRFGWPAKRVKVGKPPFYHIYEELSHSLGLRHTQLTASLDAACPEARRTRNRLPAHEAALRCNLTVASPQQLAREVRRLRRWCGLSKNTP